MNQENTPEDLVFQIIIKRNSGGVNVERDICAKSEFEILSILKALKESKDKIFESL